MTDSPARQAALADSSTHFDVLIVGAGISGIDAAYHLQTQFPDRSFALLESASTFGGTWNTHKYPGIRSDSDLFTFGYKWKPWSGAPIASAAEILKYLQEVLDEQNLHQHIHYGSKVCSANWVSSEGLWRLGVRDAGDKSSPVREYSCKFLWMCQGYYEHEQGYTPDWPGLGDFEGTLVHPQTWPEDLNYKDKDVLVIGSGATAATLVPAMADDCKHITMLQRSPTYFAAAPNRNELADMLRELEVPDEWTHEIVRRKILLDQQETTRRSFEEPAELRAELINGAREILGDDFDVDTHFSPSYRPWQQRLAFVPDGDLFQGIKAGKASVVTDHIDRFTRQGVLLKSGTELKADIIVTATGFNLSVMGGIEFSRDGEPFEFANAVGYRGFMFSDVPNMAWVFGYFRASWTLRADLICDYLCRVFEYMDAQGLSVVTPRLRESDANMPLLPWIEEDNFNPGYLQRGKTAMPKQGDRAPWQFTQDYWLEKDEFPQADLHDGALVFE